MKKQLVKKFLPILLFVFCEIFAQGPSLSPSQTVNPGTGEMGFSLPLASVNGIGYSFPINLSYKAGIQVSQEASPVGLGFSYGAGMIAKKVVFVPDNSIGGPDNYENSSSQKFGSAMPWWYWLIYVVITIICIVISIWSMGSGAVAAYGFGATAVATIATLLIRTIPTTVMTIYMANCNFIAGGSHTPFYHSPKTGLESERGKGFFKGGAYDISDIYFINTPYINGEMTWVGDIKTGHFVFKTSGGCQDAKNSTIDVKYDVATERFLVVLSDGTQLFFDHSTGSTSETEVQAAYLENENDAVNSTKNWRSQFDKQKGKVADCWYLTKVLFGNYVDGDNDPNSNPLSSNNNKGSWLCFKYEDLDIAVGCKLIKYLQGSKRTVIKTGLWRGVIHNIDDCYLTEIVTNQQVAKFIYNEQRADDIIWSKVTANASDNSFTAVNRKTLSKVNVFPDNSTSSPIQTIQFNTDYSLRPNSLNSFQISNPDYWPLSSSALPSNPNKACLTLKSINIVYNNYELPPIVFTYGSQNPDGFNHLNRKYLEDKFLHDEHGGLWPDQYFLEPRDIWGYYKTIENSSNDFNLEGSLAKANKADAWSLQSVKLPGGMKIAWEYEPNCYDMANGQSLPTKKYGGGIRVKKISVDDDNGKTHNLRYVYTANNDLVETATNSSGHATCEPYPYTQDADTRLSKARGGLYTGAKVMYENVKMISGNSGTPYGFTRYEFWSPSDEDAANAGTYGEIDRSWHFSMPKRIAQYSANGKAVSEKTWEYEFQQDGDGYTEINGIMNENTTTHSGTVTERTPDDAIITTSPVIEPQYTYGNVLVKSITENVNGVAKKIRYQYAQDIPDAPDRIGFTPKIWKRTTVPGLKASVEYGVFSRTCTQLGDPAFDDLLVVSAKDYRTFKLTVAIDYLKNDVITWTEPADIVFYEAIEPLLRGFDIWAEAPGIITCLFNYKETYFKSNPSVAAKYVFSQFTYQNNTLTQTGTKPVTWSTGVGEPLDMVVLKNKLTGKKDVFYYASKPDNVQYSIKIIKGFNPVNNTYDGIVADENDLQMPDCFTFGPENHTPFYDASLIKIKSNGGEYDDVAFTGKMLEEINTYDQQNPERNLFDGFTMFVSTYTGLSTQSNKVTYNNPISYRIPLTFKQKQLDYIGSNNALRKLLGYYCSEAGNPYFFWANHLFTYSKTIIRDYDGQPNRTITENSDGKILISENIPAYSKNPGMDASVTVAGFNVRRHLLNASAGTIISTAANMAAIGSREVVTAKATVIIKDDNVWRACSSYVWKEKGTTTTDGFVPFNFNEPYNILNPLWQFTGAVTKVNGYGVALESKSVINIFSSVITGYNERFITSSVQNARYGECLYNGFEDVSNLYSSNGTVVREQSTTLNPAPAGGYYISITRVSMGDQFIATDWTPINTAVADLANRKFSVDFYAKASQNTAAIVQLQLHNAPNPLYSSASFAISTTWKKYSMLVSFDNNATQKSYRVVLRAATNDADVGIKISYDEVRAYPAKAMMSTSVYDPVLGVVTAATDANMNTKSADYDDMGRQTAKYNTAKKKIASTVYKIKGDLYTGYKPVNPIPANGATNVMRAADGSVTLEWRGCNDGNFVPTSYLISSPLLLNISIFPSNIVFNPISLLLGYAPTSTSRTFILEPNVTYTWQVVASDGVHSPRTGDVWTFTTGD